MAGLLLIPTCYAATGYKSITVNKTDSSKVAINIKDELLITGNGDSLYITGGTYDFIFAFADVTGWVHETDLQEEVEPTPPPVEPEEPDVEDPDPENPDPDNPDTPDPENPDQPGGPSQPEDPDSETGLFAPGSNGVEIGYDSDYITLTNLPANSAIMLYSLEGKTLYNNLSASGNEVIRLNTFAPGVYILNVNGQSTKILVR